MYKIQNLTSNPRQKQTLVLPSGEFIQISFYFIPLQQGWFIPKLVYKNFTLNNIRIVNSGNILHQYRNKIPFGLACFSQGNREPGLQQDFSSGASKLYILDANEVEQFTKILTGES